MRNWQAAPTPRVIKALAHGYSKRLETMSGDEILSEESTWYGSGDTISLVFEGPTAEGIAALADGADGALAAGGKAFVDGLFSFVDSREDQMSWVLGKYIAAPASLGADYSGAWENEWTFVITVVDGTGASAAVRGEADPIPLLGIVDATGFRHTFAEPTVNVSVALGVEQRLPLTGTTLDGATTTYPVTSSTKPRW